MGPDRTGQIPVTGPGKGKMLFHWACFSPFSKFPHTNMCHLQQSMSFKYFTDLIFFLLHFRDSACTFKMCFLFLWEFVWVFSQPLKQATKSQDTWLLFPNLFLFQMVNGSILAYQAVDRNPNSYLPQRVFVNSKT